MNTSIEELRTGMKLVAGPTSQYLKESRKVFPLKTWKEIIQYLQTDPDCNLLRALYVTHTTRCM